MQLSRAHKSKSVTSVCFSTFLDDSVLFGQLFVLANSWLAHQKRTRLFRLPIAIVLSCLREKFVMPLCIECGKTGCPLDISLWYIWSTTYPSSWANQSIEEEAQVVFSSSVSCCFFFKHLFGKEEERKRVCWPLFVLLHTDTQWMTRF